MSDRNRDLAEALGHLRQAAHQLLADPDPSGQALVLASRILDVENLLEELDIEPAWMPTAHSAADSLSAAGQLLIGLPQIVPSEVWPALHAVLAEAGGHGHR